MVYYTINPPKFKGKVLFFSLLFILPSILIVFLILNATYVLVPLYFLDRFLYSDVEVLFAIYCLSAVVFAYFILLQHTVFFTDKGIIVQTWISKVLRLHFKQDFPLQYITADNIRSFKDIISLVIIKLSLEPSMNDSKKYYEYSDGVTFLNFLYSRAELTKDVEEIVKIQEKWVSRI